MSRAFFRVVTLSFAAAGMLRAQVIDSSRAGVKPPPPAAPVKPVGDSLGPPISARRAFLSSFLLPGYGQTRLERPGAAMLFSVLEIGSIGMAMKSAQDLREARAVPKDSIVGSYTIDPTTGLATRDPKTGLAVPATYIRSRIDADRVKARRVHYEDWIAAIIFNHVFAGADAYVAANLWDFRTNIRAGVSSGSATVSATFAW